MTEAPPSAFSAKSLKRPKLADSVYEVFIAMLREGRLTPGQRLPSERELATLFGVSRSTVRNAVQRLSLLGYVDVRQGDGTIVKAPGRDALAKPFRNLLLAEPHSVWDLLYFRRMLEPEVARFAAQHCTPSDRRVLEACLDRQRSTVDLGAHLGLEDTVFHQEIVRISRNTIVLRMLDTLHELMKELRTTVLAGSQPPLTLHHHYEIAEAIWTNDPERAGLAMARHLDWVVDTAKANPPSSRAPVPEEAASGTPASRRST